MSRRHSSHAGLAQLVAHHSCKVGVTGSSPVAGPLSDQILASRPSGLLRGSGRSFLWRGACPVRHRPAGPRAGDRTRRSESQSRPQQLGRSPCQTAALAAICAPSVFAPMIPAASDAARSRCALAGSPAPAQVEGIRRRGCRSDGQLREEPRNLSAPQALAIVGNHWQTLARSSRAELHQPAPTTDDSRRRRSRSRVRPVLSTTLQAPVPLTARLVPAANATNDPDRARISGLDWRLSVNTRSTADMLSP